MRAVVWRGRSNVRVRDVPEAPSPGLDEVKLGGTPLFRDCAALR